MSGGLISMNSRSNKSGSASLGVVPFATSLNSELAFGGDEVRDAKSFELTGPMDPVSNVLSGANTGSTLAPCALRLRPRCNRRGESRRNRFAGIQVSGISIRTFRRASQLHSRASRRRPTRNGNGKSPCHLRDNGDIESAHRPRETSRNVRNTRMLAKHRPLSPEVGDGIVGRRPHDTWTDDRGSVTSHDSCRNRQQLTDADCGGLRRYLNSLQTR